jgi:hypothetical protein
MTHIHNKEVTMSMQNEGKNVEGNTEQQKMHDGASSAGSAGTRDPGAEGETSASQDSQQSDMPPSETDDDQYDQGTVQRAP